MATNFVPRTRAQIRDTILSTWQSRYRAANLELLIVKGSDAYMMADAVALELELFEAQAEQLRKEILPDQASTDFLNRHGRVDGVSRKLATKSVLSVRFGCTTSATVTFGTSVVQAGNLSFTPTTSSATDGDADSDIEFNVTCNSAGTDGNLSIGATVQWSTTPSGSNATGTVYAVVTTATNDESDADYATRIILRRQERPASGNRSDWADFALQVDGVKQAFTIPGYNSAVSITQFTLGCLSVMPLGPAQGDSITNTRILDSTKRTQIANYIEGTADATGATVANGKQLRPVTVKNGNYNIITFSEVTQDVVVTIAVASAYQSTTGTHARVSSTTTTTVVAGDVTSYLNKDILVHFGTANVRGGYKKKRVTAVNFSAGNTTLTYSAESFSSSNDAEGNVIYPCPLNYDTIRTKVFAFFDALGPSSGSFERYPTEEQVSRSPLYRAQLSAAIIPARDTNGVLLAGVDGVINVTFTTPGADVTALTVTQLITLARFKVIQG